MVPLSTIVPLLVSVPLTVIVPLLVRVTFSEMVSVFLFSIFSVSPFLISKAVSRFAEP